jgi:hypothetical protein
MQITDCITWIILQQLLEYKVEGKLHLGLRKQKKSSLPLAYMSKKL